MAGTYRVTLDNYIPNWGARASGPIYRSLIPGRAERKTPGYRTTRAAAVVAATAVVMFQQGGTDEDLGTH